jgi:hypothetical protein
LIKRNTRNGLLLGIQLLEFFPLGGQPVLCLVSEALTLDIGFFKIASDDALHAIKLGSVKNSSLKKLLLVDPSDWGHLGNLFVHQWLSETWLIELIMTHLSVTNNFFKEEFLTLPNLIA